MSPQGCTAASSPAPRHPASRPRTLITFVTFGELTKWAEIRDWGIHRRSAGDLAVWHPVLPGDEVVAEVWGILPAAVAKRGRPRPVNDMWIAACALAYQVPLATLNLKDYQDFAEHHGLKLLG